MAKAKWLAENKTLRYEIGTVRVIELIFLDVLRKDPTGFKTCGACEH